jgi:hypothetical protein
VVADLPLRRIGAGADPRLGAGFGVAAAHQVHEFLRRRLIAATAVAALLRHCDTNPWPFFLQGIWFVDPQLGTTVGLRQTPNNRLAGLAGRGFIANIDVAIAHDENPLLLDHNAQLPRKVATPFDWVDRWGSSVHQLSSCRVTRERLKSEPVRALSYMNVLVFAL